MSVRRQTLRRAADGRGMFDERRKIITVGDSIGVTIPADIRDDFELKQGDEVGIVKEDDGLMIYLPR